MISYMTSTTIDLPFTEEKTEAVIFLNKHQGTPINFVDLKRCVHYIFAGLFLSLKESTCETRKNVYFTLKALFVLEKIKF